MEKITFVDAIRIGLNKYAKFSGRATRPEFWYFVLFTVLVSIVTGTIDAVVFPAEYSAGVFTSANTPISDFTSLLLLLPSLAVMVRRIRDTGRSAKVLFWWLLPIALFVLALVMALPTLVQLGLSDPQVLQQQLESIETAADSKLVQDLVAVMLWFLPAILASLAVQIYFFVLTLLKTKPLEESSK